jgi:hypothetical protein
MKLLTDGSPLEIFHRIEKVATSVKESQNYQKAAPIKFFYFDNFLTLLKYPIPLSSGT